MVIIKARKWEKGRWNVVLINGLWIKVEGHTFSPFFLSKVSRHLTKMNRSIICRFKSQSDWIDYFVFFFCCPCVPQGSIFFFLGRKSHLGSWSCKSLNNLRAIFLCSLGFSRPSDFICPQFIFSHFFSALFFFSELYFVVFLNQKASHFCKINCSYLGSSICGHISFRG